MAKITLNTNSDIRIVTVMSEGLKIVTAVSKGLEIIHYQDNTGIIKISTG